MYLGLMCVLGACFFWGLIFVVPLAIDGFTPLEIALGRYFFFGVFSILLIGLQGNRTWNKYPLRIWLTAMGFAVIANIFYYTSLVMGLWYSSAAVTALINGCAPITIAFFGNLKKKTGLKDLIIPSIAMGIGLILVNIPALEPDADISSTDYLFGLLCAFNALAIWTWYVLANARFLKKHPEIPVSDWTSIIGISTLFWVIVIGGTLAVFSEKEVTVEKFINYSEELIIFISATALLAIACSWIGFYLWNRATKYLSISLAGQITIFETVFGLIFVHFYEHKIPFFIEFIGIILMLGGVAIASYNALKKMVSDARKDKLKS